MMPWPGIKVGLKRDMAVLLLDLVLCRTKKLLTLSFSLFQAELKFIDNIVVPLVQKLKDSNVFGDSCDDFVKNVVSG